ncbi:DNA topoisomerase [Solibacillus sp. MA9]|uniref:DNA topoisomerase n=1 Tax=Solibacillus palustris TaxID=2908203 RepID=A0ABS9UAN7_9BACL|nr:DNA topoisomerase [Solibacillus sp. MA9]MCH7321408.1 DNA topoisomerase [Solibacillus sp. MA9]
MPKALLIAEKPSLMRDIEKVYKKMNLPYTIDFASFVGHVVELKEPHEYKPEWKKWDLNLLPMMPERYEFRVKKTAGSVYRNIADQLKQGRYDFVINACDAGMEGENIFYSFYKKANCTLPVKRFWTSQTTEPAIRESLENLIDENDVLIKNLRNAAMYRMIFDWLVGLNLTRAATVKGGRTIKVGRVMTPTLAIVVQRELEIRNFVPQPYFQIELDLGNVKATWFDPKTKSNKIATLEQAQEVLQRLAAEAVVVDVKTERKTMYAPSLHSLLELQKEANRLYGMTSAETLKAAQSLYETRKLVTYPRTESQHLPTNFAKTIDRNLTAIQSMPQYSELTSSILNDRARIQKVQYSKKYVDDKKLTDHHAITVTEVKLGQKKLTPQEDKIYQLIVKRLLAIFMDPYIIDKTQVVFTCGGEHFKASGNVIVDEGYTVLYKAHKKKQTETPLPALQSGEQRMVKDAKVHSKVTEPPARYTDSTLLDAMFHAGRFVEDKALQEILKDAEGIGTSATRAEILEKLFAIGMLVRDGKSIVATQFGIDVIESMKHHDIVSPVLTAIWSKKLKDIVDGTLSSRQFYEEMQRYIVATTESFKAIDMEVAEKEIVVVGKCQKCGGQVVEGFKGYQCTTKGCKFFISKTLMKAKIMVNDAKKLLAGKETREIRFTWKSGKKGKAKLKLENDQLQFVFSQPKK